MLTVSADLRGAFRCLVEFGAAIVAMTLFIALPTTAAHVTWIGPNTSAWSTAAGPRLCAWPVKELETLRRTSHAIPAQPLAAGTNPFSGVEGTLFDVDAEVEVGDARTITFDLRGIPAVYDAAKRQLTCLGRAVPLEPVNRRSRCGRSWTAGSPRCSPTAAGCA